MRNFLCYQVWEVFTIPACQDLLGMDQWLWCVSYYSLCWLGLFFFFLLICSHPNIHFVCVCVCFARMHAMRREEVYDLSISLSLDNGRASQVALVVKNPPANAGDSKRCGFSPWVEKIPWRRKWPSTPVFLTEEVHGQRSLAGYSP